MEAPRAGGEHMSYGAGAALERLERRVLFAGGDLDFSFGSGNIQRIAEPIRNTNRAKARMRANICVSGVKISLTCMGRQ